MQKRNIISNNLKEDNFISHKTLLATNPALSKEWHPTKNGSITPQDVTFGSHKKIWWQCRKGHEWEVSIYSRAIGRGCPYCSGNLVSIDNCLQTKNPKLAKEWHPAKNASLTAKDVTSGSQKKVWWICNRGHEWEAKVADRNRGIGCPYCAGKFVSKDYNLQVSNPSLAMQWHPKRNGSLSPKDVTPGSKKKIWWICDNGHEWQAAVQNRNKGSGCPHCPRIITRKVSENECLLALNPEVAKEWHPTKNDTLTPRDVTSGSSKKVWWMCRKGHEWKASIANRNNGSGCPYCSNKKVSKENSLALRFPNISQEWHPTKNIPLTPQNVTPGSNKKIWWICKNQHEWKAEVHVRTHGHGCPYCTGRKVGIDNNLAFKYPELSKDWNYAKNKGIKPEDVVPGSKMKVWWKCKNGHEWNTQIYSRAIRGHGCPYCSGWKAGKGYNLGEKFPDVAKEWHPFKNDNLTPFDITSGSSKKVWWLCKRGHEWMAPPKSRVNGSGCPHCKSKSSRLEIRLLSELIPIFKDVKWREKIHGFECDIYIPRYSIGVEVDGYPWHKGYENRDKRKDDTLLKHGIKIYRVRHYKLSKIRGEDIIFNDIDKKLSIIKKVLFQIKLNQNLSKNEEDKIQEYISSNAFINDEMYRRIVSYLPSPEPENSLATIYPHLKKEWDYHKNSPLKPEMFSTGSHKTIWWKCKKGHSWEETIKHRTIGYKCPYCSGRRIGDDNNFAVKYSYLLHEWLTEKNFGLDPYKLAPKSNIKVWWKCTKGGHEWEATISSRTAAKSGCPYCSGRRVSGENNLAFKYPNVAREWHPFNNKNLTPFDVTPGTNKKVWWQCNQGHEWKASIADRKGGHGCPYCTGKKTAKDNSLAVLFPNLVKEWHTELNNDLKPTLVTPGSRRKIFWTCQYRHIWTASIYSRTKNGHGCPYCAGQRATKENNLATKYPQIAKEWHPTKNSFPPEEATPRSNKKVSWKCNNGHEWEATIKSRTRGKGQPGVGGCPICKLKHRH